MEEGDSSLGVVYNNSNKPYIMCAIHEEKGEFNDEIRIHFVM